MQGVLDVCNIKVIVERALELWVQKRGHLKNLHNHYRDFQDSITAVEVLLYLTSDVFSELRVASLILE